MESESGISFTEFTYQLLQGYDFVHLCREHGVRVQVRPGSQPSREAALMFLDMPMCYCNHQEELGEQRGSVKLL
jgi:tyrosyl-tRNA synthetase